MTTATIKQLIKNAYHYKVYTSSIPVDAIKKIQKTNKQGIVIATDYYVSNELIGKRFFEDDGKLFWEYGLKNGKYHGNYYYFHDNGELFYQSNYTDGKQSGLAVQWTTTGQLVGISYFENGTGIDFWCIVDMLNRWELGEEKHYKDGLMHGLERWWNADGTVWREGYYQKGLATGVFREWDEEGLKVGFPKFFIDGQEVDKQAYLTIQQNHKASYLPAFKEIDNLPQRTLHPFYVLQRQLIVEVNNSI